MKKLLPCLLGLLVAAFPAYGDTIGKSRVYELRTYYASEGKLDALHARFRDHTCGLFEKHGIKNVAYWVPIDNKENKLIYVVSYPNRKARDDSWKALFSDPAWKAAYMDSTKDGKLVAMLKRILLSPTNYSPELRTGGDDAPRIFEMRTYTAVEGRLPALHARFRHHTCALFEKHGITNVLYAEPMEGEEGAGATLTYFVAHQDAETRAQSFGAFRKDPAWQAVRRATAKAGPILEMKEGVKSVILIPTDYSPMK